MPDTPHLRIDAAIRRWNVATRDGFVEGGEERAAFVRLGREVTDARADAEGRGIPTWSPSMRRRKRCGGETPSERTLRRQAQRAAAQRRRRALRRQQEQEQSNA